MYDWRPKITDCLFVNTITQPTILRNNLYLSFALLCILITSAHAQTPTIQWQKSLGGSNNEYSYDIRLTSDSGYIIAGCSKSANADVAANYGDYDAWVIKLTASGAVQWKRQMGGSSEDVAVSIQQTSDGGYIMAGNTSSADSDVTANHGSKDIWVVKFDPVGGISWQKTFGGSGADGAVAIRETPDSGYVIAGYTSSADGDISLNRGSYDLWVFKLSASGTIEWQKTYGGLAEDYASSIQCTNNGYIVAGFTTSSSGDVSANHGSEDVWVLQLSDTGAIVWQKTLGGSGDDFAEDIIQTIDSGYILACGSNSANGDISGNKGHGDAWIVKLSQTGALQWQKNFGSSQDDAATSIRQLPGGDYVISGWVSAGDVDVSGFHGSTDYWIAGISATGTLQWQKSLGSLGMEVARGMQPTPDSGYIMTGYSYYAGGDVATNHGGNDIWVVKLLPAPVRIDGLQVGPQIVLSPNPTTGQIAIEGMASSDISVYSISGQLIKKAKATNVISIAELPAGIYTIKLSDESAAIIYTGTIQKL
jgi:hypothetical protein